MTRPQRCRRRSFSFHVACGLLTLMGLLVVVAGNAASVEPATPPGESPLPELVDLEAVRAQVGSPTDGSVFAGTESEPKTSDGSNAEFQDAYQRVAARSIASPVLPSPLPEFDGEISASGDDLTSTLRSTARLLETAAWADEDAGRYAQADRRRKLARQLRLEARRSPTGATR